MASVTTIRLLRRALLCVAPALVALEATPALAHPGHPSAYPPYSVAHYLTSPVHLTALGAVVAIGVMAILRLSSVRSQRGSDLGDNKVMRRRSR